MGYPLLYTAEELALMWCKLRAGRHPTIDGWKFEPANAAGAMALITVLIGPSRCLAMWRRTALVNPEMLMERRKHPR